VGFEPTVRLTVFEFNDSHAGSCRVVTKRVLWFGISHAMIPACGAPCHAVLRGSFAIPFANPPQLKSTSAAKRTNFRVVATSPIPEPRATHRDGLVLPALALARQGPGGIHFIGQSLRVLLSLSSPAQAASTLGGSNG